MMRLHKNGGEDEDEMRQLWKKTRAPEAKVLSLKKFEIGTKGAAAAGRPSLLLPCKRIFRAIPDPITSKLPVPQR